MSKNVIIALGSFVSIILIIVITTISSINNDKKEEIYKARVNDITKAAQDCVKDKKCSKGNITIKELKDKEYIEKIINPKTNKEFSDNSYVVYPDLSFFIKK